MTIENDSQRVFQHNKMRAIYSAIGQPRKKIRLNGEGGIAEVIHPLRDKFLAYCAHNS